jgi:hypothetical protein
LQLLLPLRNESMKKSLLVGVVLILLGLQLVFPGSGLEVCSSTEKALPSDEYTITIYRCNRGHYEKIITRISPEDAACMKKDFEAIDQACDSVNTKVEEKISLLKRYHILPEDDPLEASLHMYHTTSPVIKSLLTSSKGSIQDALSYPVVKRRELFGVIGFVQGEFSGISLNFLNFIALGIPLFIFSTSGSITYLRLLAPFIRVSIAGDNGLLFLSLVFIGFIGLIPFLSPNGVIAGISIMSYCTSY